MGEGLDRVVRVEPAGVGHDPELGCAEVVGLSAGRGPGSVEGPAVRGHPRHRNHSRPGEFDECPQPGRTRTQLLRAELVGAGGGTVHQVGDAESTSHQVGPVLAGHTRGWVDAPLDDPGQLQSGIEPVARAGEMGLYGGCPQAGVDAHEQQAQARAKQVRDGGAAVGLQLGAGEAGHAVTFALAALPGPPAPPVRPARSACPAPTPRASGAKAG